MKKDICYLNIENEVENTLQDTNDLLRLKIDYMTKLSFLVYVQMLPKYLSKESLLKDVWCLTPANVNQVFCNPCFVIFYTLAHEYDHQKLAYIHRSLKGFISFYYQINLTEGYGGCTVLGGTSPIVF